MKRYDGPAKAIIGTMLFIAAISLIFAWKSSVWTECRAAGHSIGYCWSLISR